MSNYFYCDKWFFARKRQIGPLTSDVARKLHVSREPYTVLVGDPDAPSHVISFGGPWVTVSFLDELLRQELNYDFKEEQPGSLFLSMAIAREFSGTTDEIVVAKTFSFNQRGNITIEERNLKTGSVTERFATGDANPNREQFPEFGSYDSLSRRERESITLL